MQTRNVRCGLGWVSSFVLAVALVLLQPAAATAQLGPNLANGVFTGGLATPVQAAAYGGGYYCYSYYSYYYGYYYYYPGYTYYNAYVYNYNSYYDDGGTCADNYRLAGTLCDEAPTTDSTTVSSKSNPDSGATWIDWCAGTGTGVLVVDLGVVQTFDVVHIFQQFAPFNGVKATLFRILAHPYTGATPPDWQDEQWFPLSLFEPVGPGTDLGGSPHQVTDPTVIPLPQTPSRYVMVQVRNDGSQHPDQFWNNFASLRSFKLFLIGTLAVDLLSFRVAPTPEGELYFGWATASETDAAGFNLHQEPWSPELGDDPGDDLVRLNRTLIPAEGSPSQGVGYRFVLEAEDVDDTGPMRYWLEDIDIEGESRFHDPVVLTTAQPHSR